MVGYISARPVSGRVSARNTFRLATALGGTLAIALLAFPHPAAAQNECGIAPAGGGTVTCSTAENPYADGIVYVATNDLTIVLADGIAIDTSGSVNPGINAINGAAGADLAIAGSTNTSITTDADGAFGVFAATDTGAPTITLDEITTSGINAVGIVAGSNEGAVSVSANDISTSDTAFSTLGFADSARNLWLRSADAISAQLRAQRDALWSNSGGEASPRVWVQLHASKESRETSRSIDTFGQIRTLNSGLTQDFGGVQLGLDIGGGAGERGGFAFGVTGGYMASELNLRGTDEVSFDTANAGVYGSFSSGNLFANVMGKYDHYWADVNLASIGFGQDINGSSYGARGEVGFRFGSDSFFVEPAASISWVNTSFDDFTAFGTQVSFEEDDGLRGRAGARIGGMLPMLGSTASFYLGGNYVHEFQGEDGVVFTSGGQDLRFTNARLQDYGEALAGINVGQADGISGFAEGTYTRSFKDNAAGELPLEGYGGRVGMRVRF